MPTATYQATRRDGAGVNGSRAVAAGELAGWVRGRYAAGWRRLVVVDASTGEPVAEITRHPDTGRRVWWADDQWPDPNPVPDNSRK
jgi:hypothetical protein